MSDLSSVKVGDRLFCNNSKRGKSDLLSAPYYTVMVERVTKTQVICQNSHGAEVRFRVKDGSQFSTAAYSFGTNAFIPTQEQIDEQLKRVKIIRARSMVLKAAEEISKCGNQDRHDAFWLHMMAAAEDFERKSSSGAEGESKEE